MVRQQCNRKGYKDSFAVKMLSDARFEGDLEFPWCEREDKLPSKLIPYSKAKDTDDHDQWVCFNEDDYKYFKEAWLRPDGMLDVIKRFSGAIGPDFSMYRDMPLMEQYQASFKSKTFTQYWQKEGMHVIPNVRWADNRTFEIACLGVPRCSTIAIGSHGALKDPDDRRWFVKGLSYVVDRLSPKTMVIYGRTPESIFGQYMKSGIRILRFPSECEQAHEGG